MNCEDMINIPELKNVLNLKAGFDGIKNTIRWIYFADCLQCVKKNTASKIIFMAENLLS